MTRSAQTAQRAEPEQSCAEEKERCRLGYRAGGNEASGVSITPDPESDDVAFEPPRLGDTPLRPADATAAAE